MLTDERVDEAELRASRCRSRCTRVWATSAPRCRRRARAARPGRHRRRARLRTDRPTARATRHHRSHGQRSRSRSTSSATGRSSSRTSSSSTRATCAASIDKIVSQVGRRIDEATPMVDARLPDGSRVNAVIHPLAIGGPFLTIRRFAARPVHGRRPHQLRHAVAAQVAHFIEACVRGRLNVVVCGGTGTGKTTLLNVAVVVHPRGRAHRHDRGRQGAPAPAAARAARSRRGPPNIEGARRGQDPRPRAQRAAHAARPDRRR